MGTAQLRRRLLAASLDAAPIGRLAATQLNEAINLGFAPWLAMWLDDGRLLIGTAEQRTVRTANRAITMQARAVRECLRDLLREAENTGVSVCLLKGSAIEPWVYPGPGFRPMGDIDLLVAPHEQAHFESLLRRFGYVQRSDYPASYYTDHHHSMPFWHPRYGIWIEVHKRLYPEVVNVLRERQEAFDYDGVEARRLEAHAQILYTAVNWADPFRGYNGLIPLIDLGLLLARYGAPEVQHYPFRADQRQRVQRAFNTACALLPGSTIAPHAAAGSRLEAIRSRLLLKLAREYIVDGSQYTRWGSFRVTANYWKALMDTGSPVMALARLPWWLLFPPETTRRFHPGLLLQRISRLWRQEL